MEKEGKERKFTICQSFRLNFYSFVEDEFISGVLLLVTPLVLLLLFLILKLKKTISHDYSR